MLIEFPFKNPYLSNKVWKCHNWAWIGKKSHQWVHIVPFAVCHYRSKSTTVSRRAPRLSLGLPRAGLSHLDICGLNGVAQGCHRELKHQRLGVFPQKQRPQAEAHRQYQVEPWTGLAWGELSPGVTALPRGHSGHHFVSLLLHQVLACTLWNKRASQSKLHQAVNTAIAIHHLENEPI